MRHPPIQASVLAALVLVALPSTTSGLEPAKPVEPDDAVQRAIRSNKSEPRTIFAVRQRLKELGGTLNTFVLANRGHSNPARGSFILFQTYSGPMKGGTVREGDLFFGIFTENDNGTLSIIQDITADSLM